MYNYQVLLLVDIVLRVKSSCSTTICGMVMWTVVGQFKRIERITSLLRLLRWGLLLLSYILLYILLQLAWGETGACTQEDFHLQAWPHTAVQTNQSEWTAW